jgi:hypothetical protein
LDRKTLGEMLLPLQPGERGGERQVIKVKVKKVEKIVATHVMDD